MYRHLAKVGAHFLFTSINHVKGKKASRRFGAVYTTGQARPVLGSVLHWPVLTSAIWTRLESDIWRHHSSRRTVCLLFFQATIQWSEMLLQATHTHANEGNTRGKRILSVFACRENLVMGLPKVAHQVSPVNSHLHFDVICRQLMGL